MENRRIVFVPKSKDERLTIFENDKRKYRIIFKNKSEAIVDARLAEVYRGKMKHSNTRVLSVSEAT